MFGIKNVTAVEIDQLRYQKLPWYGNQLTIDMVKLYQTVILDYDGGDDIIGQKEISHMRMGGRKSEAQKA